MSSFRELPEHALQRLSDDDLIAYIRGAASTARPEAARTALAILVFGYIDIVRHRVRLKVPAHDVDDVAHGAMLSAFTSAFDGQSVGEFRAWLHRIVARRIADYHRKGRPEVVPLPDEGDDDQWGEEPSVEPEGEAIDVERAVEQALSGLSEPHRQMIDLYVFEDLLADEAAARVEGMTEANVHQIASRFRKRLREILEGGDTAQ